MVPAWLTDTVTRDLDRALHYTLLWGLEALELRTVGGAAERVPFVNEAKLRRRLAEHELPVAAIVPGLFEGPASDRAAWMNEVAALEETLAFCARIGCTRVVTSAFSDEGHAPALAAEALRRAGEAAARRGITLAVLNEAGMAHPTAAAVAELLDAVGHPAVQAAWHPAEALRAGEPAETGLAALGTRIALVRCSDRDRPGDAGQPVEVGDGAVGWPAVLRRLHEQGYDGPVSLEVHREPRPRTGLRDATRLIQYLRAARRP
ncbi:AP endonuclease [Rhodothermaceae bacterium RA]|nr:AP endonuclease [Rhodothermaceae bacterium RA]